MLRRACSIGRQVPSVTLRAAGCLMAAWMGLQPLAWANQQAVTDADLLAVGRRIYREGMLPSGKPLQGLGPANVTLSGKQAACATCHRRSGYGSSEGPIEVLSITGPALFGGRVAAGAGPMAGAAPVAGSRLTGGTPAALHAMASAAAASQAVRTQAEAARANAMSLREARLAAFAGTRQRPSYDEATLARAIREGIGVTGHAMNAAMPRYALDPAALAALSTYLKTLSVQVSPGVEADRVHFATVIQPGTDPARRRALVDVLQAYMLDRNLSQRSEVRREETGVVRLRRTYREWVLHVWELSGTSDTWGRQLEAYNAQQPVFALVSGLGSASWRPIHEFSERFELPCIFPQAEVPVLAEQDFYTVYLSKGMALEAQALAKFLHDGGERGPVTQVFRHDDASAAGAEAFRRAWQAATGHAPEEQVLEAAPDLGFWQQLAAQGKGGTLVLWLRAPDLEKAQVLTAASSAVKAVYLSSNLLSGPRAGLAADASGRVRLVYAQDLPQAREARLDLARRWLHSKGIAPVDEKMQMNAYLAATVTGLVVSHAVDTYSRDYLLERMEHRLGTANEISIYPTLSLGPGQRYASKGSYIVQVDGADDRQLKPVSDWIVP